MEVNLVILMSAELPHHQKSERERQRNEPCATLESHGIKFTSIHIGEVVRKKMTMS